MSEHYRQREYAGCTGCAVVALFVIAIDVIAIYGIVSLVKFLVGL